MKSCLLLSLSVALWGRSIDAQEAVCTHGKLYLTDTNSPTLRIIDLNGGSLANLAVEHTMAVPGHNGQWLDVNPAGTVVKVISWGNESLFYADGQVRFVATGVVSDETVTGTSTATSRSKSTVKSPTLLEATSVECRQAYHFTYHDTRLAIACDGSYEDDPPVDNSFWIIDEGQLEQGKDSKSAVITTLTTPGSHHGAAFILDNTTILHSVATADRVNRVNTSDPLAGLPNEYQLVDFQGNLIGTPLNDTSDVNRHCTLAHGNSFLNDTLTLACGQEPAHGGMLVTHWDNGALESRALLYPSEFPTLRVGDWGGQHPHSQFIVSDLSDWSAENATEFYLMAMDPSTTQLTSDNVLTLDTSHCGYGYEKSHGRFLVVFLATGVVQWYTVDPTWTLVAEQLFVPDMVTCDDAGLIVGYDQVFATHYASKTLYALSLKDSAVPATVSTTVLDFDPYTGIVAQGCGMANVTTVSHNTTDDHDNGHNVTDATTESHNTTGDHAHDSGHNVTHATTESHNTTGNHDEHDSGHNSHDDNVTAADATPESHNTTDDHDGHNGNDDNVTATDATRATTSVAPAPFFDTILWGTMVAGAVSMVL